MKSSIKYENVMFKIIYVYIYILTAYNYMVFITQLLMHIKCKLNWAKGIVFFISVTECHQRRKVWSPLTKDPRHPLAVLGPLPLEVQPPQISGPVAALARNHYPQHHHFRLCPDRERSKFSLTFGLKSDDCKLPLKNWIHLHALQKCAKHSTADELETKSMSS